MFARHAALLATTASLLALACGGDDATPRAPGAPGVPGAGGAPGNVPSGAAGTIAVTPNTGRDPTDMRMVPVRKKVCVDGQCTCLRLALLGTLESAANQRDTKPFIDWLNANSDGTATVTMVSTKPRLDAAFLADYDILLVANVNAWSFSAAEKAAVERWVREVGGGIIALTGFTSNDSERAATSQLIEFSGVRFEAPKTAENGQPRPVYYKGGTADLKQCLAWTGSSEAIITTPIQFKPQTGSLAKLTLGLDYIGAYIGWAVATPPGATAVATDPVSGATIAVAHEVDGKGRIFALGDEWVIFANQWMPQGEPHNRQMDPQNVCWQPPSGTAAGFFHSVQTLYQTKQFWYDAINWVAPPNECSFILRDPDVVIPK